MLTEATCEVAQEKYAEAVASIRGEAYDNGDGIPNARVAYIEFGSGGDIQVIITLDDVNNKDITPLNAETKRIDIYNTIRESDICDAINIQNPTYA